MASRGAVIEQMAAAGIVGLEASDLIVDGQIHRFKCVDEKKENGWYVLFDFVATDGQRFITGSFGSWKLGGKHTVSLKGATLSRSDRKRYEVEHAESKKLTKIATQQRHKDAEERANKLWPGFKPNGKSAYLEAKGIGKNGGRFGRDSVFVVPVYNEHGALVNLQFLSLDGKKFLTGGQKKRCFHILGKIKPEVPLIICEGYSTAASLFKALGWPTVCAFDAENLVLVAEIIRKQYPSHQIVIAGDMDLWTPGNKGRTCARMTARKNRAAVVFPEFQELNRQTDFNDLYLSEGLEVVAEQVKAALRVVPDWRDKLAKNDKGRILPTGANVSKILRYDKNWRDVLAYCEFSNRIIKRRKPPIPGTAGEWTDHDTTELRFWLADAHCVNVKRQDVDEAVAAAARNNGFHPVREYLEGLEWDGIPRIDCWLSTYLGAEGNDYTQAVGQKFLIGAVARVMEAPVKMDYVLILDSMQGVRKSSVLSTLASKDWFSDTYFAIGDKDGYQQMQGIWIYELAELDSFNKVESTRAKQFFGSETDRYRDSYGRRAEWFPRQGVFVGTTNHCNLKDHTGNRRYWPVKCARVDIEALARARGQLWAEALQRYRAGMKWWPSDDEKSLFEEQQEARYTADVWEPLVVEWLNAPDQRAENTFSSAGIMKGALEMTPAHMKQPENTRVGIIMKRIGWEKDRLSAQDTAKNGKRYRPYVYVRPRDERLKSEEAPDDPF